MKVIFATKNPGKLVEIRRILGDEFEVLTMTEAGFDPEIIEDGTTFEENALIKVRAIGVQKDALVMADDSGLCVDAFSGGPGVYSARYCGHHGDDEANNDKLLRKMAEITDRSAAFHSVIALKRPGQEPLVAEGICPGVILRERRGTGGFGYDPLFLYEPLGKTFAELTEEEKNAVSHRARACEIMINLLTSEAKCD